MLVSTPYVVFKNTIIKLDQHGAESTIEDNRFPPTVQFYPGDFTLPLAPPRTDHLPPLLAPKLVDRPARPINVAPCQSLNVAMLRASWGYRCFLSSTIATPAAGDRFRNARRSGQSNLRARTRWLSADSLCWLVGAFERSSLSHAWLR